MGIQVRLRPRVRRRPVSARRAVAGPVDVLPQQEQPVWPVQVSVGVLAAADAALLAFGFGVIS